MPRLLLDRFDSGDYNPQAGEALALLALVAGQDV
jgi:hypothetical protein